MKHIYLLISLFIFGQTARSQVSYTWNGSVSTAWNTPGNWTPNGIPGGADNVTIVTGSNTCLLNATTSINNIILTSGTLDLGGFALTIGGVTATFTKGTLQNGSLSVPAATTTTFTTGPVIMNCAVTISSATITIKNTTFQGVTNITKTGGSNDNSGGNNIFNGVTTITNNSSGQFLLGNGGPDQFNANTTFNDIGGNNLYIAYNGAGNVFGGVTTFNNAPTAGGYGIYVSWLSAGTVFSNNIVATSTNGQGVQFCGGNGTASASLSAGNTISIGGAGFSAGTLLLRQFTQIGPTAQNLALTGTGALVFGPISSFDGNVTSTSPSLYLHGCSFNGTSNLTKTGATGDFSNGGNLFNGICSITNSGSSYLVLGNNNPDTWNSDVTFTDNGSERLLPCWATAGNQFNGNIIVNTSGSAQGIQFCGGNATATATLAATKTIQTGGTGLTAGYLYLKQFTQLGSAAINLTATGGSVMYLGPNSNFGGTVTVTAPDIWAQGATYSSAASFTKTGGSSNHNNQNQNIFNSTVTINQQSNGGYFMLGYNSNDLFNDNITVTSTGSGGINLGWNSGTGTPTLAAGKTIQVGAAGFSAGYLNLNTFTQLGNAPMNLTFTGANTPLTFARGSVIGGNLTTSTPDIFFNGCTFNGTVNCTKTGAGGDNDQGGNVFNGLCSITNSGSGYLLLGNTNPDIWNNDVTFTDNGSERLLPCWGAAGNQFNGNITVNTSGSAQGIQFCGGNAIATATLAATKTIQAGATGLTNGYLYLKQFTQSGSAPIALTATGPSVLYLGPGSNFGGTVTVTAPDIWAQGATYNSAASFTKTGGSSNHNQQNQNIFNSTCTINQQSSGGYFMLGYNSNDLFNDNITLTSTGTGGIYLGWTSGTGTPTLAAGKTISVGAAGFSSGFLSLNTFTQLGNAPMNLSFTGASTYLTFARNSVIGGDLTTSSPDIYFNGCTFNGATNCTKTGANGDFGSGGNTFNGVSSITNNSTGFLVLGNNNPDTWNNDVTFTDNGSERLLPCWGSTGNQFNGNIFVNTSGSAQGIQFCGGNNTATATVAATKAIQTGAAGLNAGYLILRQFTQLGNAPISLTLSSTATYLQYGPLSALGGDVTSTSPGLFLNGCTFNGATTITKTGPSGDYSQGGNIFNGVSSITNSGSSYLLLGNSNPDIWNNDVGFTDNGSERLLPCWATAGNQFNGNITVNTSGSAQGIQFCGGNNTSTATLAAGKTIQSGATGLNAGYLILRQFTQLGNAPISLTLASTATYLQYGPLSALGGNVVSSSPGLFFNGCTFGGTTTCTKTGASNDNSSGNNIFNGVTTITNNGGQLLMGNGNLDQFNANASFNNTGTSNFYIAYNSPANVFGGVTTFNNAPSTNNGIYVSWNSAGTIFNNNIVVSSTNGQGVQFCGGNGTATATLSAGNTISVGPAGFSAGTLLLRQFTQVGATAQTLPLTGTGILTYGPSSAFGGDVVSTSPSLFLNGCSFNGSSNITKTGTTGDYSQGGNIFNGVSSITNSGSSYLLMGNNNPDTWNNDVTFTDNGSERLLPCWATVGNQFNGNIFVNTAGSAQGIQFCGGNNTATATLAATKAIQTGATGLNAGYLIIRQFTQLGNAPINLNLASTATYLQYGPLSALGGDVVSTSPGLFFNGCSFGGAATCTKTGASNDASSGNNIFNGVALMTNSGSGNLIFGNGNRDQFNANATFNNTGSSYIHVAYNSANNIFGGVTTFNNAPSNNNAIYVSWNSTGTVFNNNIVVTSTNGQGVQFCGGNTGATASLSAGNTISVGPAGFSAGTLLLRQFTQVGGTAQNLALTGTGNLTFGTTSAFGGNTTTTSPTLFFNGCNFGGTVTSAKNGATSDASIGNNIFNGPFVITNTGTGYFLMGNGSPDIWQSTATFNNLGGQHMYTAYNSTGNIFNGNVTYNNQPTASGYWIYVNNSGVNTQFNGNISLTNSNGGGGIYFGNGSGTATLAGGGSVSIGGAGFVNGGLIFKNFTQSGLGIAQNLTTVSGGYIQYGVNSSFDGPLTSSSPGLFFNGCKFNGTVNCTKTGTTNDQSQGNNIFNGSSTFTNNGTGYLLMTVTTPDAYNNNVTFVQNSTGLVYPNYNGNSVYTGNVTVTSPSATAITFGAGSGTATFSGTSGQSIGTTAGTAIPVFTRLVIANTSTGVTLNAQISVSGNLQLSSGLLNTTTTSILTMLNGSTTAVGNALSTSYVNGPMQYYKSTAGITTLNFPIGASPDCRPVALTVNHTNGTSYIYQAQLFDASARKLNYTLPPSVDEVSDMHYYTIGRFNAAMVSQPSTGLVGNQTIQIFFAASDSVSNGNTLTIVKNTSGAPTTWINIGGVGGPPGPIVGGLTGSITSTSSPTAFNSFSTFALADQIGGGNVLPVGLLYFHARPDNNMVDLGWATSTESNNSYFTIERSRDGVNFEFVQKVSSQAIGGNSTIELDYTSQDPNPNNGVSYYRLTQTDLDGKFKYSNIVSVNFDKRQSIAVYPNPTTGTIYIGGLDISVNSLKAEWFDVSGKFLLGETVPVQGGVARLDAHFNNGVYLLRFIASDGTFKLQNVIIMK